MKYCWIVLAVLLLNADRVAADKYRVDFAGGFTSVPGPLTNFFSFDPVGVHGDTFTGHYIFEASTPATPNSDGVFAVYNALHSATITVDRLLSNEDYVLSFSPTNPDPMGQEIQIDNNPPAPFGDRYGLVLRVSEGLSPGTADVNGAGGLTQPMQLTTLGFRLDDPLNNVFSDSRLPTDLELSDFQTNALFLFYQDEFNNSHGVIGVLSSLSFTEATLCDLNDDQVCNTADLRELYDDINAGIGTPGSPSDIDGSGFVDNADITAWLAEASQSVG